MANAPIIELTLAHSPDPDDAFMWWPITGKVRPNGSPLAGFTAKPAIDTGRFRFLAVPEDIEALNRRAAERGDLDITALSFRAWLDVKDRYVITRTGSSFGDGFGPKLVTAAGARRFDPRAANTTIAIPGLRTTAFLVLNLMLGGFVRNIKFVEMPFDQVIPAVAEGRVNAGLVIHEGQVLFADAGLALVTDLGVWWKQHTGLPLPLGCNALRRDLDERYGPGTIAQISTLLRQSLDFALEHRVESLAYTLPFALANKLKSGGHGGDPTLERVDKYVQMYVNRWTIDMGEEGRNAVESLYKAGAKAFLCPDPGAVDIV